MNMEMEVEEKTGSSEEGQLEDDETEIKSEPNTNPPTGTVKLEHNQVVCQLFGSFYNDSSNEVSPCYV